MLQQPAQGIGQACGLSSRPARLGRVLQLVKTGAAKTCKYWKVFVISSGGVVPVIDPYHLQSEIVMEAESIAAGLDSCVGVDRAAWPCREDLS